jgi:hypothetical protein
MTDKGETMQIEMTAMELQAIFNALAAQRQHSQAVEKSLAQQISALTSSENDNEPQPTEPDE